MVRSILLGADAAQPYLLIVLNNRGVAQCHRTQASVVSRMMILRMSCRQTAQVTRALVVESGGCGVDGAEFGAFDE